MEMFGPGSTVRTQWPLGILHSTSPELARSAGQVTTTNRILDDAVEEADEDLAFVVIQDIALLPRPVRGKHISPGDLAVGTEWREKPRN